MLASFQEHKATHDKQVTFKETLQKTNAKAMLPEVKWTMEQARARVAKE